MKSLLLNPILIGGILPFLFYGLCASIIKTINLADFSKNYYIIFVGIGIIIIGILGIIFEGDIRFSAETLKGDILKSIAIGLSWGLGTILIFIALSKLNANLSQIAPIFNSNTLIAVLAGIFIFSETVKLVNVSVATILVIIATVLLSI